MQRASNGYAVKDQDRVVLDTVRSYRHAMREFAGMTNLEVWYARLEVEPLLKRVRSRSSSRSRSSGPSARWRRRSTRDSMSAFSKLTQSVNGRAEIVDESPLIVPLRVLLPETEAGEWFEWLRQRVRAVPASRFRP